MTFIKARPRLTAILSVAAFGSVAIYFTRRHFDRSCPRIPITDLPQSSACRYLLERAGESPTQKPWGMETSTLLASWSGGDKTHWVPSFTAHQVEVPLSLLAGYGASSNQDNVAKHDAHHLMQNFVAAFLDARATGPEATFLDKSRPSLSFMPASMLFGDRAFPGAFMLGTWSSTTGASIQPLDLPSDAIKPVSEFFSNRDVIQGSEVDTAGAVMYWKFPDGLVKSVDQAASYGCPWRLMEGGFQEFIVERVSDEKARLTYVTIECSNIHPEGQATRDFKRLPWVLYEAHVLYAQSLLAKAISQLGKPTCVE
ncbi:hypothetical protein BO70DRAFT_347139 [Aspergillus heteromorphus CBS 117.55]|uniref:Uncharacterized protein n=1 Tax=Aspergillus heteromorphus CBS 117.55 TaxID=1448321 RepID=A0A317UQH0_9EURO|nr:uncharacterized protein BO70DRAFT_347139 [Aspergillus heteromorphus CBS 117.55]PWY64254.1 hypothetical protein BO70DRAFT_347139 [Aspergillus heteromorphus CBS 117.55]